MGRVAVSPATAFGAQASLRRCRFHSLWLCRHEYARAVAEVPSALDARTAASVHFLLGYNEDLHELERGREAGGAPHRVATPVADELEGHSAGERT